MEISPLCVFGDHVTEELGVLDEGVLVAGPRNLHEISRSLIRVVTLVLDAGGQDYDSKSLRGLYRAVRVSTYAGCFFAILSMILHDDRYRRC